MHSSLVAEAWLAWHSIPDQVNVSILFGQDISNKLTEIHNVVPADGAVVNHNVYEDVKVFNEM